MEATIEETIELYNDALKSLESLRDLKKSLFPNKSFIKKDITAINKDIKTIKKEIERLEGLKDGDNTL